MRSPELASSTFETFRAANWSWFDPVIFKDEAEILDLCPDSSEAAQVVADLERASMALGIADAVMRRVLPLIAETSSSTRPARVLEMCAGNGWFSRQLAKIATQQGLRVEIVALDTSPHAIAAGRAADGATGIEWRVGDALRAPFADGTFDLVVNLQSLHHFPPASAVALLAEVRRLSERFLIYDLRRTAYGSLVMAALRPFFSSPFTRDAITSHRRAYSLAEARFLLRHAGVHGEVSTLTPVGMAISGAPAIATGAT